MNRRVTFAACAALTILGTFVGAQIVASAERGFGPDGTFPATYDPLRDDETILVGTGCGPSRETLVAREEDEFGTTCEAIDAHWVRPLFNGR